MDGIPGFFDAARFAQLREAKGVRWGRPLRLSEVIESTSDLALEAIPTPMKTGAIWLTREQTRGRGRRGSVWLAPPGENLTFSVLLRPPQHSPEASAPLTYLSLVAGLAVLDLVATRVRAQHEIRLKWPNDVYIGEKKCAGILVEGRTQGQAISGIVVGVGLNVRTRSFPEALRATSLSLEGALDEDLSLEPILADFLVHFERHVSLLWTKGFRAFLEPLRARDALLGKRIRVNGREGIGAGIDDFGALLLDVGEERPLRLESGHIEWLSGPSGPPSR